MLWGCLQFSEFDVKLKNTPETIKTPPNYRKYLEVPPSGDVNTDYHIDNKESTHYILYMIYFVACVEVNAVKIGYSTSVQMRTDTLQTGCPLALELLTVIPGHFNLERALHYEFAELRIRGEWFRLEGPLRALVRKLLVDGPHSLSDLMVELVKKDAERTPVEHGTVPAYMTRKCRCFPCRDAWREYQSRHRLSTPEPPPDGACSVCYRVPGARRGKGRPFKCSKCQLGK